MNATDGSFVINNSIYTPYTLGSGNVGNVFIGTGPLAYGSGVVGGYTGNNIGIGWQALKSGVNPGSVVAIGVQACMDENGNGNTDPGAGNGVCLGDNAGSNDPSMADFIVIGQKAYTDVTPGSVGGLAGSVVIGVHTDGIDGMTASTLVGDYIARSTNNQPITGTANTIIGESNFNCVSCTALTAPSNLNWDTVVGVDNMANNAFGSQYAVAIGVANLLAFKAGSLSGGTVSSNIAIGNNNLQADTTGVNNVAVGNNTLNAVTTTGSNTAVGASACSRTSTGSCTALGFNAAGLNTTSTVTAIGVNAAARATGNDLTAIGLSSAFNVSGIQNVYIGDTAGSAAGAAADNTVVGYAAGENDTTSDNVYVGRGAGASASGGTNTALGFGAMQAQTATAANDVAVGANAMCTACTHSEMVGQGAVVSGSIAGAAQIGSGTNSTANTLQFQTINFLDNVGNANFKIVGMRVGTQLTAAATITPTAGLTHVTGSTPISTITVPSVLVGGATFTGCLNFIPTTAFTTVTGGNIALASSATVGRILTECYDGTFWYPSY